MKYYQLSLVLIVSILLLPIVAAAGLEISDIEVEVDGESNDDIDADGGTFEAAPEDDIQLTVEVENTYAADTEEHQIENIDISINIDNFCPQDIDDEIDEEIRIDDLDPAVDDSATFSFRIPDCADEDNFDLDIRVEGRDEDGTEYVLEESLTIQVEKDAEAITLELFEPDPAVLSCDDLTFTIAVEAHNIGAIDQDVGLLLIQDDLGINRFDFLDLRTGRWTDDDTGYEATYTFTIDDDVPAGEYDLRAEIEYEDNTKEIKRYQTITVLECEEEAPIDEESEQEAEEENETAPEQNDTTTVVIPVPQPTEETEEKGDFLSTAVLISLLIAGIVILAVLVVLLRKK